MTRRIEIEINHHVSKNEVAKSGLCYWSVYDTLQGVSFGWLDAACDEAIFDRVKQKNRISFDLRLVCVRGKA